MVDIQEIDSNVGTVEVPLASEELQEALGHTRGGDRYFPPCTLLFHGPLQPATQQEAHGEAAGSLQLVLGSQLAWDTPCPQQRLNSLHFSLLFNLVLNFCFALFGTGSIV